MSKPAFFAVNKGRKVGVFSTWDECYKSIEGFSGAKYKKFHNKQDAEQFAGVPMDITVAVAAQPVPKPVNAITEVTAPSISYPPPEPLVQSKTLAKPVPQPVASTSRTAPTATKKTTSKRTGPVRLLKVTNVSDCDVVYTDGACQGNGKPGSVAGVGVWWGREDVRNISERCPGNQTNNRAELIAIARVLETAKFGSRPLLIKTDSKYSRDCFEDWIHNWVRNNWRNASGQPVKNAELIEYISALIGDRYDRGQHVYIQYVKGHSGDVGNDGADALAVAGCAFPALPERDWSAAQRALENRGSEPALQETDDLMEDVNWDEFEEEDQDIWGEETPTAVLRPAECVLAPQNNAIAEMDDEPPVLDKGKAVDRPTQVAAAAEAVSAPVPVVPAQQTAHNARGHVPIALTSVRDESVCEVVYTDGACPGNGKPGSIAGIGVWRGPNHEKNLSERCPGAQTNNRAELIAIARALETTAIGKKPLVIKTDSKYSRDCFYQWIHNWVRNGWRSAAGHPVKNADLIQYISSLLVYRNKCGQTVHLKYVKGHSGDVGNDGADRLAVEGCQKPPLEDRDWDLEREKVLENPPPEDEDINWEESADWLLDDDSLMAEIENM